VEDVTFIIPVKLESEDRRTNMRIVLKYLQENFPSPIIIYESDKESNEEFIRSCTIRPIEYMFEKNDTGIFHRTRLLNEMTKAARTKIVANYDIDVLFPVRNYIQAEQVISKHGFTASFPYGGKFYDIPKSQFHLLNKDDIEKINLTECEIINPDSVGGAFFFNKDEYFKTGLENENFISWGFEDFERVTRLYALGNKVIKLPGVCYHLTHYRDKNGDNTNPYYAHNRTEYTKIKCMSKEQLEAYIKTWDWVK